MGRGAVAGAKAPLTNEDWRSASRSEKRPTEEISGVLAATAATASTHAEIRDISDYQLQAIVVHCLPATHEVVWLALCTALKVNCTDDEPPCRAFGAPSGRR